MKKQKILALQNFEKYKLTLPIRNKFLAPPRVEEAFT